MAIWPDEDSKSKRLYERGRKVYPGGITRLVPWLEPFPVYTKFGKGAYVTDVDGTARLDLLNNFASLIHGHCHPAIIDAVSKQLVLGTAFTNPTEVEIELAELLCDRIESAENVRFSNSGSEAVMSAIKAARAYTGRPAIVKVEGGYHGSYDYAEVSLDTPRDQFTSPPKSVGYAVGVPDRLLEDVYVIPFNDPETAANVIRAHKDRIGAILLDAAPSYLGFTHVTPEFAAKLRDLATEIGAVFILDEVITFRLDHGGAQKKFGVKPDLTVLGKIIGGGFPVGALVGSKEVMKVFDHHAGRPLVPWSGTFSANPITMVAGKATLDLLTPELIAHINALGDRARAGLTAAFASSGFPGQVTGVGSMFKIITHQRPVYDYRSQTHTAAESAAMVELQRMLVLKGFHVSGAGMAFLSTAMVAEDIDKFCAAAEESLCQLPHPASGE
ncbi:aspartate aminotransferase family protein [Sphingobium vermicomposti]|uniref:Glutamate-1-semialdehyde 2,1-aminomutase n=1 Tax=Sphingobium vermicomposti TaxID=529005 RepID=A0A846MB36_9SPHN|nr:aspartate aminotransferase family protein [Sphingobium vermicomposti]NIJ17850.1 glutamate-1-semialdehyde 2,1-aminomutase [Sphingobium vermicomposti]